MDISANPLDLIYFTNSTSYRKINKKNEENNKENNEEYNRDLLFYRKRILQKTKDLLRGCDCDANIEKVFKEYTKELIRHLKFTDKKDIIQEDYNIPQKKVINLTLDDFKNKGVKNKY